MNCLRIFFINTFLNLSNKFYLLLRPPGFIQLRGKNCLFFDEVIAGALLESLVIGLAIALLWVYFMIPDIQVFLILAIITGLCVANTVAFMVAFGLQLNFVTYIEILLSIGA